MVGLFGPLFSIFLARFGYPPLADWLYMRYSFDLYEHKDFIAALLIVTIPMLIGMMTGFLMLDERDENVISYYAVTPLMRRGYLSYRLALPSSLSIILTVVYLFFSGLTSFNLESLQVLVLLALETPWFALLLAAFSANKVEGLALSKISALFIAGPIVVFFVPDTWQWLGVWIPTYWPASVFSMGTMNESLSAFSYFSIGFVYHLVLLLIMIRLFNKRVD